MSLFSTTRSVDRSTLTRGASAEDPRSSLVDDVEPERSLPRQLLVSLAGITADVASVQRNCVDTPDVHAALDTILGRLDDLVDSVYQRSAHPAAPTVLRTDSVAGPAPALAALPGDPGQPGNVARLPSRVARSLPDLAS